MTQEQFNTNSRKGTHLSYQERCQIAILKKEGYSNRAIAKSLGRSPQTIHNEVKRGSVTQRKRQKQKGKIYDYTYTIYDADAGKAHYDQQRLNCGRRPKWAKTNAFVEWADTKMLEDKWSPDVVVGFARENELFETAIIPCTTTLYHWIDSGVMKTRNLDLLEKLSRNTKKNTKKARRNQRVLGPSIEERPQEIETRKSFGHWEIDTVIGSKVASDPVLLTLVERKTRYEVILKIKDKTAQAVDEAIESLRQRAGESFSQLFKTITSDNGSEFAGLHTSLQEVVNVYFTHPYASWERGTSENQHKIIRRFLPKGQPLEAICDRQCLRIQNWMNDYPRKQLGYQTPHDLFIREFHKERKGEPVAEPVSA